MSSKWYATPWNIAFFDFTQVVFWTVQGEENEFPVIGDQLNHRFLDITKVEFWVCQEAENDF